MFNNYFVFRKHWFIEETHTLVALPNRTDKLFGRGQDLLSIFVDLSKNFEGVDKKVILQNLMMHSWMARLSHGFSIISETRSSI